MSLASVAVDVHSLPTQLLADAKMHLRVDAGFDDEYIVDLLARTIAEYEAMGDGLKINPGQWAWSPGESDFDLVGARIPITPINTIAIAMPDPGNPAGPPLDVATDYGVTTDYSSGVIRWRLVGAWQSGIIATIDTGYADPALLPADLKSHLLDWVTRHYEYRSVVEMNGLAMMPEWKNFVFAPTWNPKA